MQGPKVPYIVLPGLSSEQVDKWQLQFADDGRDTAEGMWRRSHDEYTERVYNTAPGDRRRRLVHFLDQYDIINAAEVGDDGATSKALAITQSYVYVCSTLPHEDIREYWDKHHRLCQEYGWNIVQWDETVFYATNGDYEIRGAVYDVHKNDVEHGTVFPEGYQTVEVTFRSQNEAIDKARRETPWQVWQKEYHRPQPREAARVVTDLNDLKQYLPMHIELGGGPSIEAGIPPLNYFHHTYSAYSQNTGGFAFGDDDSLLERIIGDLPGFFNEAAQPYRKCFLAKPTAFYGFIEELRLKGLLIEPLINNNFDGLAKLSGFKERYIRRYGAITWRPDIDFDPAAKALLVVGSHSDRRRVRMHARQSGLQIIHVDPEVCYDEHGDTKPYPLEDVEAADIVVYMGANQFSDEFRKVLDI